VHPRPPPTQLICSWINTAGRLIQARFWTATLLCMRRPFALATQLLRGCPRILTSRRGCCRPTWQGTRRARAERVLAGVRPPLHARICRRRARLLTRRGTPTWRGWPMRGRSTRATRLSCTFPNAATYFELETLERTSSRLRARALRRIQTCGIYACLNQLDLLIVVYTHRQGSQECQAHRQSDIKTCQIEASSKEQKCLLQTRI